MTTEAKLYTAAMRVDILKILEKEDLGVYELRRIQNIAKTMVDFVNSLGTYYEKEGWAAAMRETSDDVAPSLHEALVNRTFDGEAAVRELYVAVLEQFSTLKDATTEMNDLYGRMGLSRRPELAKQLGLPPLDEMLTKMKKLGAGAVVEDFKALGAGDAKEEVDVDDDGEGDAVAAAYDALAEEEGKEDLADVYVDPLADESDDAVPT